MSDSTGGRVDIGGQDAAVAAKLEVMQVKGSLEMYNYVSWMCFRECAEDMRNKDVTDKEHTCVKMCVEKFLNITGRASTRFGEFYSELEKEMMEAHQAEMFPPE